MKSRDNFNFKQKHVLFNFPVDFELVLCNWYRILFLKKIRFELVKHKLRIISSFNTEAIKSQSILSFKSLYISPYSF
jgi:hypothetical protein